MPRRFPARRTLGPTLGRTASTALVLGAMVQGCGTSNSAVTATGGAPGAGATTSTGGACAAGQTSCNGACVTTTADAANCGTCGIACQSGQSCTQGACVCQTGLTNCSGSCVDPLSDSAHCGVCGTACTAGQVCSSGQCSASCQSGLDQCGSSCVDMQTNLQHCGQCDHACPGGRSCVAGQCACPGGQTECSGACVDAQTDAAHCGSCSNECASGATCTAGACSATGSGGSGNTGGSSSGGVGTGGSSAGGTATGGGNTGGSATGGTATGGSAAGGTATGGSATGGTATGGSATGGTATGGTATGGSATGGTATGGGNTGGSSTGGSSVLAGTPPMGWNSWNKFAGNISESLIKATADAMVSSGMKDVGYTYVNIDDVWQADSRDGSGKLVPDSSRFPGGMKALADYVHGLGLKIGIYSDRGTKTCAGKPGSYQSETEDAQTFADWGIDYLKYDNCSIPAGRENDPQMKDDYTKMGEALKATGRPIVFSICAWWFHDWMPTVGNLWRTTTDIQDQWANDNHSIISLLNKNGGDTSRYGSDANLGAAYGAPGLAQYAGPGHWNDPDMLEVGNGGMTETEQRAHFTMWVMMAAPLITGNDLRSMSDVTKNILTNPEVIAVNQDALGKQGKPISSSTTLEVWSKQLSGSNTYAVVLFNRTGSAADITVTWSSLGLSSSSASVRDLWARSDVGTVQSQYTANVPSHGVVMLKVVGQ